MWSETTVVVVLRLNYYFAYSSHFNGCLPSIHIQGELLIGWFIFSGNSNIPLMDNLRLENKGFR